MNNVLKTGALAAVAAMLMSTSAFAVTLQMHNGGDPGSLDPHKVSGDWENRVVGDYIEGLVTEDANADAIPGQAESWEISEDGLVYTFKLRDGIQWTDGTPVTAGDFVFAFQRLMNPATASEYAYLQYPIKNAQAINAGEITDFNELGVKALDDKTVEITLEAPTPYFLQALTHYTAYPVPKHKVEELGDAWTSVENIVANGPYKIVEWLPGSYVRSEKNPDYYDAENVQIDEVYYHVLEDQAAALNRYRAGEFDILTDFPADQYQWIEQNLPGQAHVDPFLGIYYYVLNQEKEPLNDIRIREALSISVLRDVIGPDILGTGELPAYGWVPPGTANYEGEQYLPEWSTTSYEERVERAKALMTEAGYTPENPLTLQLRYNTNDNHQRIAVALAAMWEPIGVRIELFNAETAVHYDALRAGDFQIGRAGWLLDYSDAANTLDLLKTGTSQVGGTVNWGNNYGRYSNEEFDSLLNQAATEQDLTARAGLLHQAEEIAMNDFAAIPIYWYVSKNVVSPKITGFVDNAKDIHRTRWLTKSE